jgi:ABC-type multidrug transport system fused ATPase/permease subunit
MKKTNKQNAQKVFKDGVAKQSIDIIVENLPNIMFISALAIRACIGVLLWMHAATLFKYVKDEKVQIILSSVFVIAVEVIFTAFSLASAKLRKDSKIILGKTPDSVEGKTLLQWANTFFIVTLVGSFAFNAVMLYWTQSAGDTSYFNKVSDGLQLNIFIQVMNAIAVFTSEGSAFILNSNISVSEDTQKPEQHTYTRGGSASKVSEMANELKFAMN